MDTLHLPDTSWPPAQPFWDGCRESVLRMPRCECRKWIWYLLPRCPACGSERISWVNVSGRATLFTWTTVHRSFVPGHQRRVPYITALVELEEDPQLRLATFLVGHEHIRLRLGLAMRVDFETIENDIVLPVFRPAP